MRLLMTNPRQVVPKEDIIAKAIADGHGARLTAASDETSGTTFTLTLTRKG